MSKHWHAIRSTVYTGLLLLFAGCASWHTYDSARTLQPGQSLPYQLRAMRADSSRVELTEPFIRSDSLYGRLRGDTVGLALADIASLERSRFSGWRTAALVFGVPTVGLGLAYIVLCEIGDCGPVYDLQ
jgi:hypothetical protein